MSDNIGQYIKNISVGISVGISTRERRNEIYKGIVKKLLTKSEFHTHGIMVELVDGTIGRVKEIYSSSDKNNDNNNPEKKIPEEELNTNEKLNSNRTPQMDSISIEEDDTGYSYRNLFYPYIKNATEVVLEDAYIRMEHQIKNLGFFCTLFSDQDNKIKFHLKTNSDNSFKEQEQKRKLEELRKNLDELNILFTYEFDETLHDRIIRTNTGWKIILGRGLDIYKDPGSYYSPANFDQTKRKCKKTEIVFIRNKDD